MHDSMHRLHQINNHLAVAATKIEDFGLNILDAGKVSEKLKERCGITLWQLRNACDELHRIEKEEGAIVDSFEKYLDGKEPLED